MINYKKKIAYFGLGATAITAATLLIIAPAGATAAPTSKLSLAGQLAQTFHLNQTTVQQTISQYYKTHPHHKNPTYKERLSRAVKNGKISLSQEQAIITEHKQLIQSLHGIKNQSPTQRKASIKAERTQAKSWATSNKVPLGLLYNHQHHHKHS